MDSAPAPTPVGAPGWLAEVKARFSATNYAIATESPRLVQVFAASTSDVPRLVAALEAVLAMTEPRDEIDRDLDGNPEQPLVRLIRCDEVRAVIESALRDAQGGAG